MNLEDKKYDAFISYRHADLDKFVAENLHKQLELFKLPKALVRKNVATKTKIERVFRDRDELPLASDLAEPIMNALSNSEFLIVICTPRLPQSQWCKREVETFIKLHGRSHVFAVLAEGEPSESFPPALLYEEVETTDEQGNTVKEQRAIEPLAADVRGKDKKEVLKKIKEEVLRLLAPMFDVGYDDLRQRHRERRIRQIMRITIEGAFACFLFGVVSMSMALQIKYQSNQIEKQNVEIAAQAQEIEEQYNEVRLNLAKTLAENSLNLLAKGDRKGALYLARAALPTDEENPEIPYSAQAQFALTEAIYAYGSGKVYVPINKLEAKGRIVNMAESPSQIAVAITDVFGEITIWDPITGDNLATVQGGSSGSDNSTVFLSDDSILYLRERGYGIYNFRTNEEILEGSEWDIYSSVKAFPEQNLYVVDLTDRYEIYTIDSNTLVYSEEDSDSDIGSSQVSSDGTLFAYATGGIGSTKVRVINLQSGEESHCYEMDWMSVAQIMFSQDEKVLYVVNNESFLDSDKTVFEDMCGEVCALDLETYSERLYTAIDPKSIIEGITFDNSEEEEHSLIAYSYGVLMRVDEANGTFCNQVVIDGDVCCISNGNVFITNKGSFIIYFGNQIYDATNMFYSQPDAIETVFRSNKCMTLHSVGEQSASVYAYVEGKEMVELYQKEISIIRIRVNEAGNRCLVQKGDQTIDILNESGEIINTLSEDSYILDVSPIGNGEKEFAVIENNKFEIYDINSGEKLREYDFETSTYDIILNEDRETFVCLDNHMIQLYSFETGELLWECSVEDTNLTTEMVSLEKGTNRLAVVNPELNKIEIYELNQKAPSQTLDMDTKYIATILWVGDGENLYIEYQDNLLEVVCVSDGTVIYRRENASNYVFTDSQISNSGNLHFLYNGSCCTVMDQNYDMIAQVPKAEYYSEQSNCFYCTIDGTIYSYPMYSLEQLLVKADSILENYDKAEIMNERYYLTDEEE